jgi:glyoxylase-like metal-dependent hydrolase (beta-lactamase superfamily II)
VIERVITSGTFSIDGEDFAVDNNVWLVGDEHEVLVIDAAHDHRPILDAVAGRRVVAIVATHGHNDHINAGAALAEATGAPILLHPADAELWAQVYPDRRWDADLSDGDHLVAGSNTLFRGGPGATGRSFSDFPTIIDSIRHRLLTLPPHTVVHTGHGDSTTIGEEAPHLHEWIERGH